MYDTYTTWYRPKDKYLALKRIADFCPNIYGIVFCRTRRETQEIADALIADGYNADALHGDLSQAQRDIVMQKFRMRNLQLLIATDVAARGLDVTDLTHVINYGLPDDIETYTHRSGRTGRAGKSGISVSIVHSREKGKIRAIEKIIGKKFEREHIPTGKQICEKQLYNWVDRIEKVEINESEIEPLLPPIFRRLSWLDEQDLIRRFVSLEFNRLLEYYRDAPDIDLPEEAPRERKGKGKEKDNTKRTDGAKREKGSCIAERGFARLFVNQGRASGCFPANLIELINSNVPGRINIGRIDLFADYSLIDVEEKAAQKVIAALKHADFFGNRVYAEIANPDKKYGIDKKNRWEKAKDKSARNAAYDRHKDRSSRKEAKQNGYNYEIFSKKTTPRKRRK